MTRRPLSFLLVAAPLAVATIAADADAVGTRTFALESLDDLSGGELEGTAIDSLGHVRAGFRIGSLGLGDANAVWSAVAMPDGSALLGTGNGGKILRVANGQATVAGDTGQVAVTSLAVAWNGAVVGGTMPKGRVVRLEAGGKVSTLVDLPGVEDVWALAFDAKQGALFAATGPEGKIFRIDARGQAQVYFDSDEPHVFSLAVGPDGALYAGSSGKALLYRITGPGRASVVLDFPGDDVRALAFGPKGVLYAISNEYPDAPDAPKRASTQSPAGPVSATRPKPGKGTLTRILPDGRPEKLLHRDDTHFVSLAVDDDGRPYVGTGVEGRVYSVDDAHTTTIVADTAERQVGAMVLAGKTRFVATSDPPVFHEVRGVGGADAVWTSKVLDAGLRAHFGRIDWQATGPLELSTRSGDTQVPDGTWSAWSQASAAPFDVTSPGARFLQVRARFSRDPSAVLSEIVVPFVTDNLRAIVTRIDADPKNAPARSREPIPASGGEPPSHSSVLKLSWKVDNPDNDPLRYRLSYRLDGQRIVRDLTRPDEMLTKTDYDWETAGLPEGRYRVRVEASDENANPPERTERHALESGIVLVDNTPPVFRALAAQGRRITGDVVDGVGPIARIDVSVDGRPEWHPYLPKDGVFDEPVEQLELDVAPWVAAGNHLVAVRVFDAAGNFVVRDLELK